MYIKKLNEEIEQVLTEEKLYEMATAWIDRKTNTCAWVENPTGRNNRYFKYLNSYSYAKANKVARISLDSPTYLEHTDTKERWVLSNQEKKILVQTLLSKSKHYNCNQWQEILIKYNYDNLQIEPEDTIIGNFKDYEPSGKYWDKGPFSLDTPMPDYMEL